MNGHMSSLIPPRPPSEQLVDLHVYLVPEESWNEKYRSAYNEIINETISAGFVRVMPEMRIYSLREEIEEQIGHTVIPDEYVFLRSVGRCLTQLKGKQESELKVKNFLPPLAYFPEIFVLPCDKDSVHAHLLLDSSRSPRSSKSHATQSSGRSSKTEATQTNKEFSDYRSRHLKELDNESLRTNLKSESRSRGSHRSHSPNEYLPPLSATPPPLITTIEGDKEAQKSGRSDTYTHNTNEDSGIAEQSPENEIDDLTYSLERKKREKEEKRILEYERKKREIEERKNQLLDQQITKEGTEEGQENTEENQENRGKEGDDDWRLNDSDYFKKEAARKKKQEDLMKERERLEKEKEELEQREQNEEDAMRRQEDLKIYQSEVERARAYREEQLRAEADEIHALNDLDKSQTLATLDHDILPPEPESRHGSRNTPSDSAKKRKAQEKARLLADLEKIRGGRQAIEKEREDLVRRAKLLQNNTQNRRTEARDYWKKMYFGEKKKTPPLEERVNHQKYQLDINHRKILQILENKKKNLAPSEKNNQRINIAKIEHDIEELRRRVENSKMRLSSEMKLRNQAETELRALRAEVTKKKMTVSQQKSQAGQILKKSQDIDISPRI